MGAGIRSVGAGIRSIATGRAIRAQAGRTQNATLALAAAGIAPTAPVENLDEPAMPENPMTGGDGLQIDEESADGPFTVDDIGVVSPEGIL